jgi:hypothetical protein
MTLGSWNLHEEGGGMALSPGQRREWEEEGYGALADLLDRVWPAIRGEVWLCLPAHRRWKKQTSSSGCCAPPQPRAS